ncbi:hypothetical protein [Acinetobacter sp. P1(2025)]|uniref:hypothetical protein n=1 Tax=Acinetobacter sp. P1(2025) TaxID=3446120 RepID=UPI003F538EB4
MSLKDVAISILNSLGGKRILDMKINAKDYKINLKESYISFSFTSRNAIKANYIKIYIINSNLIKMQLWRNYGKNSNMLREVNNILIDELASLFQKETLLELSNR